jgi:hypothetical protein
MPKEYKTTSPEKAPAIAISRAVRLAFRHPNIKRKDPTYIDMSVTSCSGRSSIPDCSPTAFLFESQT